MTENIGSYRIGGTWAMTHKTLRQSIKSLARNLDDPRFDDWDDEMILLVLGQIINVHRARRDEVTFHLTGNTVMTDEQLDEFINRIGRHLA